MFTTVVMLALGGTQPPDLEQRMEERFAQMHARIGQLEQRNDRLEAENNNLRNPPRSFSAVSPSGNVEGRQMSANPEECCRWTPDGTCTGMTSGREKACTMVHEYLETKTTTHSFDDITDCAGAGESNWGAEFNGVTGNVTLKNGATTKSTFPTPLKVTHSATCTTGVQPTLDLQLDTTAGVLNVAESLSLQGTDLTSKLLALSAGNLNLAASLSLQGTDLTSTLLALAVYKNEPYASYPELACVGRNELKSSGAAPATPSFAECRALCDAAATCSSFEYKASTNTCTLSTTCIPLLAKFEGVGSPGYTCVPTPSYMCPHSLPARSLPAFFSLRSHAPGPPADARSLPGLPSTNQRTLAAHPIARRDQKFAISRPSSGGRLNVKKALAKSAGRANSADYTWCVTWAEFERAEF